MINSAWDDLKKRVQSCRKCELCETRNNIVLGEGPTTNCRVVIVGEAPGEEEDKTGRPFVGNAGQLLTRILENGGNIPRNSVYITNTLKCRPPINRDPKPTEVLACREYLEAQLLLLRPDIVVSMGKIALGWFLNKYDFDNIIISKIRGKWQNWRGLQLLPMFHPSYLLRNSSRTKGSPKYLTWQDVLSLKARIDELQQKK